MPAKPPKAFDVWFVAADTVYKGVPYNVVADWTRQGRLGGADMVRPAGTDEPWLRVADHDLLADYLTRPAAKAIPQPAPAAAPDAPDARAPQPPPVPAKPVELPEPEPEPPPSRFEDDDDVDMIPLIDISMVLLVFFIIIQATGALAPVDVPEMKYAGQLSADPDAVTVSIEKLNSDEVYYSVRVGAAPPLPKYEQLKTPEDARDAVLDSVASMARPPEVRIACRKDLPRERVYELRRMLEVQRQKGSINSTVATVVEAPEQ